MRSTSKSFWGSPGRKPLEKVGTGVTRDRFIDADVHLSADVYVFLIQKQAEHPGKEIAGFGVLDDNALMTWASVVAVGQPSSVSITALDAAWSEEEAFRETGRSSNVQIHSHPGMGCFWSSVDTDDQWKRIDGIRDYSPKGEYYFIVFDATKDEFLARKVEWDGDVVRFNDGTVFCGGRDIGRKSYSLAALTETKPSAQAATGYSYYNTQSQAKHDSKKKEEGTCVIYAGALTDKLEAYLFSGGARPPFDTSNNWAVYQAMLDISAKRSVPIAKIARDIIAKERAVGTYVSLSAGFSYPAYAVNCKIDSMGTMSISSFLEVFLRVHETPVTAQTPNDILLSQAFSVSKNMSYAWVAWDMIDAKGAISSVAVNARTAFGDEPRKIKRDDFAYWARVHDHSILNAAQRSSFHELKSARFTSAEAKSSRMLLVGYLADILNSGKPGLERVVKEPTITNFDLAMLRRAIAINRPTMCQLFDNTVSTSTLDGSTPELVANQIIEFCVAEAESGNFIERSKLESVYRLIDALSVGDNVKMFDILDKKQGSLTVNEQWILSLMFTGSSGLIPMPLVISDVLSLSVTPISLEDYENILIGAMNVGVGYMLLMALSQIDIETSDGFADEDGGFVSEEIDVSLGEYGIMKISDEEVSLYQDKLI